VTTTLHELLDDAEKELLESLRNKLAGYDGYDISDVIHEIADSNVPIYNAELIDVAHDPDIFGRDVELEAKTPLDMIRYAIYEALEAKLFEVYQSWENGEYGNDEDEEADDED
jgi:hypothetical protein